MKKRILVSSLLLVGTLVSCNNSKNAVADGLVKFDVEGKTDLKGNFFLSFVYSRNLVMLDGKGNIVWSKHEDQLKEDEYTGFWDFKKHDINGETYYSYHDNTGTYDNYGLEGYGPGERVILDKNFKEVKRITFEDSSYTKKGDPLDGHDFLMIDLDHYILSGYIKKEVTNVPGYEKSSVVYSYLQEVKSGEVVWDFASINYEELYSYTVNDASTTANDFSNSETDVPDYIHFNSMRIDNNENLICSFRHINATISLNRSKKEDQINRILSGPGDQFGLTEEQKTSCQHYATIDGDYITLFDNGNKNEATRLVSYKIDEENKKLLDFKEYKIDGKYSKACGSTQHLNDEIFVIGWGAAINDSQCMSVYDFSKNESLMTVTLQNQRNITYRCVYYE